VSHTRAVAPSLPVTIRVPSGLNVMSVIEPVEPFSSRCGLLGRASHTLTASAVFLSDRRTPTPDSRSAATIRVPSGSIATLSIEPR
jgi:hypothetical protein